MPKILIIDDVDAFLIMMEMELSKMGYEVQTAGDGEEGWQVINQWMPDIVITDLMMPKLHGLDLLSRIRNNERTKNLPVLCITSDDDPEVKSEARATGATGWIMKPFDPATWQETLNRILSKPRR